MPTEDLLNRVRAALVERYHIQSELGRGGTAVVFRAHDPRHDRYVAVKVLRPELTAVLGPVRFEREIRIAAQLQHPHILPLYESGLADGLLYYVMPFIAGETLQERIRQHGPLPQREALTIAQEIARALAYAHAQGVVHRDIKPANILMSEGHALVADFGVARAVLAANITSTDEDLVGASLQSARPPDSSIPNLGPQTDASADANKHLTVPGAIIGTPCYMSPEQVMGRADLDGRSDIYSLGCVLYEMLTQTPPFAGTRPEMLMAQHLTEPPPSIRTTHPAIPRVVAAIVDKALAKEREERFADAGAMAEALEGVRARMSAAVRTYQSRRWMSIGGVAAALVLAAVAGWTVWRPRTVSLASNRIVVFPLWSPGSGRTAVDDGEAVATYIGYALDGTAPLRWIDGWESLSEPLRLGATSLTNTRARAIAIAQHAAYYIDGSIVRAPDSVTVLLVLHSVAGDSVVARTGAAAAVVGASLPHLGVHAVAQLLPAVMAPGRHIDVSSLAERNPVAVAYFLEGEQEYRHMRFANALADYSRAIDADSLLAIAALKAAQAANWQELPGQDTQWVSMALRHASALSERQRWFAQGLQDYMRGAAAPALDALHHALLPDSTWAEALTALGEVYYHLVPNVAAPDSLAQDAFERAWRADPEFTPPMYHLAEIAVRQREMRQAASYIEALGAVVDSGRIVQQRMMWQCAEHRWSSAQWTAAVNRDANAVLKTAKALAVEGAQPACAGDAFQAILANDRIDMTDRWGALLGGTALYAAMNQREALRHLIASPGASDLPAWAMFVLADAAGTGFEHEADSAVRAQGTRYAEMDSPTLWLLGEWSAHRKQSAMVAAITREMSGRADQTGVWRDRLIAKSLRAQNALVAGDSSAALAQLEALEPAGSRTDIEWQPWESLGFERLALAELLLARGDARRALSVVRMLDAPSPVVYPLYLRSSLVVRMSAAQAVH